MTVKLTRCIEFVPKRHAFKARFYNSAKLIKWVDFGSVRKDFNYLSNNPREANSLRSILFIQPASDSSPSSFCAFSMASRKSGSSLNWNGGFPRLFSIMCVDTSITLMVMYLCVMTYYYHMKEKTIPRSGGTLSRDLTKPLKIEVMIMANRYDNAHLCARQSKLYKFYDLSTAQVVQTKATTEREARKNLGKQSLIFIARIHLYPIVERSRNWGDYSHD